MILQFRQATNEDALFISYGFHMAMLMEDTPLERIELFAEKICTHDDVLYSARNTTIAELIDEENVNTTPIKVGMITAYDGKNYHEMRSKTFDLVKQHLGIEFPGMEDEAGEGEYYIDSLAVLSDYRGQGIGRKLLEKAIKKGKESGLSVTIVVDKINDKAEKLYKSLGFKVSGDIFIFGHYYTKMKV